MDLAGCRLVVAVRAEGGGDRGCVDIYRAHDGANGLERRLARRAKRRSAQQVVKARE